MEPLTPNDPLWNVLGQAKPVKLRANFVANVVREARQTPQDRGWLSRLKTLLYEREAGQGAMAWAMAAVVVIAGVWAFSSPEQSVSVITHQAPTAVTEEHVLSEEELFLSSFELELKKLELESDLVAAEDTSELTASEIRMLLY